MRLEKSALCRLSFEPLSCIGVAWLGIIGEGTIPMALIASTMDGSLKERTYESGISSLVRGCDGSGH